MVIETLVVALGCFILGVPVGIAVGIHRRKPTQVLMGVKQVDNRVMPDYSRAQRRAHKKRHRG